MLSHSPVICLRNVYLFVTIAAFSMVGAGCEGTMEGNVFAAQVTGDRALTTNGGKSDSAASEGAAEDDDADPSRFDPVRDLRPGTSDGDQGADTAAQEPASEDVDSDAGMTDEVGAIIDFHIQPGTGNGAWNAREDAVVLYVGQILRVYNDDDQVHQIHSNDAGPFPHGNPIQPGAFATYEVVRPLELGDSNTLYDHGVGRNAAFWLEALPRQ